MAGSYAFIGHEWMAGFIERKLAGAGWSRVDDIGQAEVAFTYCLGSSLLEDAYFDDEGLVKNAPEGILLVDLSPSTPSFAREISAVATVNDLAFVEAPLAVVDPFEPVSFACFAASEELGDIEKVRGLLEEIAEGVEVTGAVGSAQLAKASSTIRTTARFVAEVEADALADSAREVVQPGKDDDGGGFDGGLPIELALADVVAAATAADDVDLILPQLEAAMHLLELMAVIGGSDMNLRALSLLYREEAASAAHGLDWTRAEGLYAGHDHGEDEDFDGGFGQHGFDDDDFGYAGGFGGYSAN